MPDLYAWWTSLPADPQSPVPYTGWVHELVEPYRVITFDSPEESERSRPRGFESRLYDGTEDTVPWKELWPHAT